MPGEGSGDPEVKAVYFDQNIFSNIVKESGLKWRESKIGGLIDAAGSTVEVWLAPTHLVETVQADPDLRKHLASVMLEMIDYKRMGIGYDALLIEEFFAFVDSFAPGSVNRVRLNYHRERTRQINLGALALIATANTPMMGKVVDDLTRHKWINQVLFARIAADPGGMITEMSEAVVTRTRSEPYRDSMESASIETLRQEYSSLAAQIAPIKNDVRTKWDKQRQRISHAYGAFEVARHIRQVLPLPMELELSIMIPSVIENWSVLRERTGCDPLPLEITSAPMNRKFAAPEIVYPVLENVIRAAARTGLPSGTIAYNVMLREIQRLTQDRSTPSGSLTFDADHAAAIKWCSVFVTRDQELATSLKTIAKHLNDSSGGACNPTICTNARQLERALGL